MYEFYNIWTTIFKEKKDDQVEFIDFKLEFLYIKLKFVFSFLTVHKKLRFIIVFYKKNFEENSDAFII